LVQLLLKFYEQKDALNDLVYIKLYLLLLQVSVFIDLQELDSS